MKSDARGFRLAIGSLEKFKSHKYLESYGTRVLTMAA